MEGYSVSIAEVSKELTAKERIKIKDTTDAIKLDEATQANDVVIELDFFAILNIHNEKSDNKDYKNYVLVDKNGNKYVTGSESFFTSFMAIYDEMCDEAEEWSIKAYRVPSKNYKGKDFLTCAIM